MSREDSREKRLSDAAKRGDLDKLRAAIRDGADPLSLDGDGASVLHNAARFNHPHVVDFLLRHGTSQSQAVLLRVE